ncbi:MAG TPA: TetR/AcrR family transcriptional regulator C-terminal domain-containing protein [Solirubrobacterales bacterium]|jgi:AcrR family transcriptional regulator|nr:TetR/AcrR family transcriptional regulator C-terminal domain-containing protein [Solirubrobacterales bacterium]HVY96418.1 TetR/AcrR family transcriptional regulator C-terminal domain-containing protein [Solirubrobacterales bacterium]
MAAGIDTVWTRDEEAAAGPQPLSREAIVRAAIEIADADGLDAVSIRRLATKLDARPMSLYSHIGRKGDLIDLMVDEVMGGAIIPGGPPTDNWRGALRQIAQRTRESTRAHPWMIAAAFHRPHLGPNMLRHIDQSLAAVSELPLSPERKRAVLLAVDTYTLGFVRWEVMSPKAKSKGPCADAGPSAAEIDAYITAQAASGDYPYLAEFVGKKMGLSVNAEKFEIGLEWLLAGIEAEVGGAKGGGG